MAAIPYALSISHFTSSVGADAGFAAIVGLAILILLYFAQARETASLRDRFAEAAEQVRRLELQVAHLARPQAAPAARPEVAARPAAAAAAPVPSRTARPLPISQVPMAPAGVGAPALSAATRMVPSGDEGPISIRPAAGRVAVGAAAGAGAGAALAERSAPSQPPQASGGGGVIAPPAPGPAAPSPATAAGAGVASAGTGNGSGGAPRGRTPAPAPAAGVGARPRPGQDPGRPYRIAGARPAGQGPARPPLAPPRDDRSGSRRILMIIGGLLVIVGIVAVLVVVTSSSGTSGTKSPPAPAISNAPKPSHHRRLPALAPGQVTVAVLNGTSTTNLAHDVSLKLANAGYKQGAIATATDQTQTATTVGYMPGQRRAALIVARSLNLGPAAVVPVTSPNRAVACPQAACTAQVVVTVGTDLASVANSSSAAPATGAASTTT